VLMFQHPLPSGNGNGNGNGNGDAGGPPVTERKKVRVMGSSPPCEIARASYDGVHPFVSGGSPCAATIFVSGPAE